jgi:tetratricopeptide (TPR) repeat protein
MFKTAMEKNGAAAAALLREAKAEDYAIEPGQVGIAVNRLMQRRRVADALAILEAAIERWPNEPGFHARAGEAYATLGKRDDAVREYQKVLALNPRMQT